jgi:hypothetical protein
MQMRVHHIDISRSLTRGLRNIMIEAHAEAVELGWIVVMIDAPWASKLESTADADSAGIVSVCCSTVIVEPGTSVIVLVTTGLPEAPLGATEDVALLEEAGTMALEEDTEVGEEDAFVEDVTRVDEGDAEGGLALEDDTGDSSAGAKMPPSAPEAEMMERAFASLVHAMNCMEEEQ